MKGAILLAFYRGGWCPYCNYQIQELSVAFPEYADVGNEASDSAYPDRQTMGRPSGDRTSKHR